MKKIVALILAIAVLVGGWWYASPLMALDALRDAAEAGDKAELEQRVDFPKLRESLKQQLRTALTEAMASEDGDNPMGQAGAALGLALVDGMVDGFVTPEWVAETVARGKQADESAKAAGKAVSTESDGEGPVEDGEISYDIERTGFSTFRVATANAKGEAGPIMLFQRDGLGWDLVGVEMPPSELIPGS